jgi:hypothetical protein
MANTFGVTVARITGRVAGLRIDTATVPSADTVGEIIEDRAAVLAGVLRHKGIEVDGLTLADNAEDYRRIREILTLDVISTALAIMDGFADVSTRAGALVTEYLSQIHERPSEIVPAETDRFDSLAETEYADRLVVNYTTRGKVIIGGL